MYIEIIRVSSRVSSQGYSDYDRLQHGSLSPMASSNRLSSEDLSGWNGLQPEVSIFYDFSIMIMPCETDNHWFSFLRKRGSQRNLYLGALKKIHHQSGGIRMKETHS